jgi:hypothetical protein
MNFPRGPGSRGISHFRGSPIHVAQSVTHLALRSSRLPYIFVQLNPTGYLSKMNTLKSLSSAGIACLFILAFQLSCADHNFPSYVCPDTEVSYLEDVKPIVESKCAISGCHNGTLGADRNWLNFETFRTNALQGNVKNYVIDRIMPPAHSAAGPLSQDEINTIACWVDDGAPNN